MTPKILEKLLYFTKRKNLSLECADNVLKKGVDHKHISQWIEILVYLLKKEGIPEFSIKEILEEWNKSHRKSINNELLSKSIQKGLDYNLETPLPDCKKENVNQYCSIPCINTGVSQTQMILDDPPIYRTKTGYFMQMSTKKGLVRVTNFLIESAKWDEGLEEVEMIVKQGSKKGSITIDIPPIANTFLVKAAAYLGIQAVLFQPRMFMAILTAEIALTKEKIVTPVDMDSIISYLEEDIRIGTILDITELDPEEHLLESQFQLGWKKENQVFIKLASFCNAHNLKDIRKVSKYMKKSNMVEDNKVKRYPIKDGRAVRVWIISFKEEKDE